MANIVPAATSNHPNSTLSNSIRLWYDNHLNLFLRITRKPRLLLRFAGVKLMRYADRQYRWSIYQVPLLITRQNPMVIGLGLAMRIIYPSCVGQPGSPGSCSGSSARSRSGTPTGSTGRSRTSCRPGSPGWSPE